MEPVVEVDAPRRGCLAQLVKFAQTSVGHANSKRLAIPVIAYLPVVFSTIDQCVSCGTARKWKWKRKLGQRGEIPPVPLHSAALHAQSKQTQARDGELSCTSFLHYKPGPNIGGLCLGLELLEA